MKPNLLTNCLNITLHCLCPFLSGSTLPDLDVPKFQCTPKKSEMSTDCILVESGPDTPPSISTPETKSYQVQPQCSTPTGYNQPKHQPVAHKPLPSTSTMINKEPSQLMQM